MSTTESPMSSDPSSLDRKMLLSLVETSQAINCELNRSEVFERIVTHATNVLNAAGASLLLLDSEREQLVFQTATGPGSDQLVNERFDVDLGIAGQAVRNRRAVRVDDVRQNRNFFAGIDEKTEIKTQSLLAAPLIHQDRVLGVLEVVNPLGKRRFTDHDVALLKVFANLASAAAANVQAYDRVAKDARGLREARPSLDLVGQSAPLRHVLELCRKVAVSPTTVLLYGETGTGKELAARSVHDFSARREKTFIAINCAALSESLLESELFGHDKGAFTGATDRKLGRFELADGGTIFLDEIGELSPATQAKLLRVLQEREFVRVGGTQTITCDVRVIAATNRDLKQEMEAGRFRQDLYYRLNVFPITMPPLRERVEDLPLLVDHFIHQVAPHMGVAPPSISDEVIGCLMRYAWPGNIRELRNIVERSVLLADHGQIEPEHLPPEVVGVSTAAGRPDQRDISRLAEHERVLILKTLDETGWNQSNAARKLGVSRDHLRYRIKKYQLKKP